MISDGPYRFVRHPGYAGTVMHYLGIPLMLGSLWAWIPVAFTIAVVITRTTWEDRILKNEMKGYSDYAERVRYRLIPGIW